MTPDEIQRLTLEHMPEEFFKRALQAVYTAHDVAQRDCFANFASTEGENLLGYYRRAKLEGYLRDAADRYPNLEASAEKADKSGWYHTEVRGGPVVLTQNSVQTPCALVEKAEFRCTLAESSQLSFWPEDRPEDALLYVVLLHSRSQWETPQDRAKFGHLPGSAYLAYPSRTLDSYVHAINLFERFPEIVDANCPDDLDTEARVRYVRRARRTGLA